MPPERFLNRTGQVQRHAHRAGRGHGRWPTGWHRARPPGTTSRLLPMSDGGDGFGEVIRTRLQARPQTFLATVDAAHRRLPRTLVVGSRSRGPAIIESANIIGLAKLPPGKFHPFKNWTTFGLGAAIRAAKVPKVPKAA